MINPNLTLTHYRRILIISGVKTEAHSKSRDRSLQMSLGEEWLLVDLNIENYVIWDTPSSGSVIVLHSSCHTKLDWCKGECSGYRNKCCCSAISLSPISVGAILMPKEIAEVIAAGYHYESELTASKVTQFHCKTKQKSFALDIIVFTQQPMLYIIP